MENPVVLVGREPLLRGEVLPLFFITVSVIALSSLWVAKDFISLLQLVKVVGGLCVSRVLVGMLQKCKLPVGFLDVLNSCLLGDSQNVIENKALFAKGCSDLDFFLIIVGLEAFILTL